MTPPPLLLGAALVFWGWQTSLPVLGVVLALVLEGAFLLRIRWELAQKDFFRLSDACTVLFVGLVVYAYATRPMSPAIMAVVSWIPLCYYPQLLAQRVAGREGLPGGAFFWFLRRRPEGEDFARTDLSYPFLLLCILCGASANLRTPVFYAGMFALSIWALWTAKPRGRSVLAAGMLLAAGAAGYAGQEGLYRLQAYLERKGADLVFGAMEVATDPFQSQTALGRIGSIQQSDAIALRVFPEPGKRPPALLRQAAYDSYRNTRWTCAEGGTTQVRASGSAWELVPRAVEGLDSSVRISQSLRKGQGVLALPLGTWRVEGMGAGIAERSRLGALRIEYGPPLAVFTARHIPGMSWDSPPSARDLSLPQATAPVLKRLAAELGLDPRRPEEALARLSARFQEGFHYSTFQASRLERKDPLEDFLLRTHSGHCEYFATAGTLLLRAAGIPTRYAAGYSIQEYSGLERAYIARGRHAHAWTLVHFGGVWRDFDPTPSSWAETEARRRPWWGPLGDLLAWVRYRLALAGSGGFPSGGRAWLLALPLLLAGFAWGARRWLAIRRKADGAVRRAFPRPGLDSELYRVEKSLAAKGWGRSEDESWSDWEARLGRERGATPESLSRLIRLHERYRFDPAGLSPADRDLLRAEARRSLSALA